MKNQALVFSLFCCLLLVMQAHRGTALSLTRGAILRSARAPPMMAVPSSSASHGWEAVPNDPMDRLTAGQLRALLMHTELIAPLLEDYYRSIEEPK